MQYSLFLDTERQTPENLTTEVLKYILLSKEYSVCQSLFYNLIFGNNKNLDTKHLAFNIETQSFLGNENHLDCLIKNKKAVIVIENKFFAAFTKDDQIYRYCKQLQKRYPNNKKYLILLTIKSMKKYYEEEIMKQFRKWDKVIYDDIDAAFRGKNIIYRTLLWDDLLKLFPSDNCLIPNLETYISEKFLKTAILSKEELKMADFHKIPELINKFLNGVDNIKIGLASKGIKTGQVSSGRDYYGYYIEGAFGKVWFGYYVSAWLKAISPYALQIYRKDWIKRFDEKKVKKIGFNNISKELGFIFPIRIDKEDFVNNVVAVITKKINELEVNFGEN